jgi:hypothetical protein
LPILYFILEMAADLGRDPEQASDALRGKF